MILRKRRLVLLAGDFTSNDVGEMGLTGCVDAWSAAGFIKDVVFVDLGLSSGVDFKCVHTGKFDEVSIGNVLSSQAWNEIVVISVRLDALAKVQSTRVTRETSLLQIVSQSFPSMGAVKTSFFTLSWLDGAEFDDSVLPHSYTSHLVHDAKIYVDNVLAFAPFDDQSRPLSMAFTALIAAGGFGSQVEMPLEKLVQRDGGLQANRIVRPVRAIARAASGGWFFQEALRRSMTGDIYVLPSGILNAAPDTGSQVVLNSLVEETVRLCGLRYEGIVRPEQKKVRLGLIKAILYFFKLIGKELRRAGRVVVAEQLAKRTEPFANALQGVYGADSIVQVRGASGEVIDSRVVVDNLLQHLTNVDLGGASFRPDVEPQVWRDFAQIVVGSLDGSEMPDGITVLTKGNRIVFTDPAILGPSPDASVFPLSTKDRETVKIIDDLKFREPDVLDPESLDLFEGLLSKAKQRNIFDLSVDQGGEDKSADLRIRGSLSPEVEKERTPHELEHDFAKWRRAASDRIGESFLGRIAARLESEIEAARADVQFDALRKILEDMAANANRPRRRRHQLVSLGILGVGALSTWLASRAGLSLLGVAGFGLVAIWVLLWVVGNAIALARGVVREAIRSIRQGHQLRTEDEVTTLFESSQKALQEYIRLKTVQRQFYAWSRILREIIHQPYGRVNQTSLAGTELGQIPHPRQFAIASVSPTPQQMQFLSNLIRQMVLVKGYLKAVLNGVLGAWRAEYQQYDSGGVIDPYSDARWGFPINLRVSGEPVCYPLQDFFNQIADGRLQSEAATALQSSIESRFHGYEVRDFFGQIVEVDADHRALLDFDPSTYLFDYLKDPPAAREDFAMSLYRDDSPTAIVLKSGNVDRESLSAWSSDQRLLGNFDLRVDQRLVMMTHLVVFGKSGTVLDLSGCKRSSVPQEEATGDKPDL